MEIQKSEIVVGVLKNGYQNLVWSYVFVHGKTWTVVDKFRYSCSSAISVQFYFPVGLKQSMSGLGYFLPQRPGSLLSFGQFTLAG